MNAAAVIELFKASDALLEGHFQLSSGLHSSGYLQSALVLQHPAHAERLGRALADRTRDLEPTVVLSPALGGVIIGHEVARALGIRALFVEREQDVLKLRRGFQIGPTDRVLVVEDVVTTGGSTRATMSVAQAAGAAIAGVAAIINRGGDGARFEVPFVMLADVSLPAYEPAACPLCAHRVPAVRPGSRPHT